MVRFSSAASGGETAADAVRSALRDATSAFGGAAVELAVVFVSAEYADLALVGTALEPLGDAPVVGGISAGCVFGGGASTPRTRGASVLLLGGPDLGVRIEAVPIASSSLVEIVPRAEAIARFGTERIASGYPHLATLVFAPSVTVDGESVVAAARKGVGVRANLAGCLTGDDSGRAPLVFVGRELRPDHVVLAGMVSKRPIGVAARHGWTAVGARRTVTRSNGVLLLELDGRPALDVWVEDARAAGADPPSDRGALAIYLTHHHPIGIDDPPAASPHRGDPSVVRAPYAVRDDGTIQLSGAIAEGTHVRVFGARRDDLLRASSEATASAVARAGSSVVISLVLACASRVAALGESFPRELAAVREGSGAPIVGGCVYGEIARNVRDENAFFNTTTVVVAFPA